MSREQNKKNFSWQLDSAGRECLTDESGRELGNIFRAKDVDGDLNWMYSINGYRLAARSREMAKIRLESAVTAMLQAQNNR
jgi:hypothetical protein